MAHKADDAFLLCAEPNIQCVSIGEHQAIIIDDFLQDPDAMKNIALNSAFEPYPNFDNKKGYPGVRAQAPAKYSSNITEFLEPVIKLNFGIPEELPLRKSMCAFSLTTIPAQQLGPLQRTPHFDASTPYHMAVLLYLCDEKHGGTGFYRHKATGLQQITEATREHYLDVYYEEINAIQPPPRYFDDSNEHFSFLGMIPAKFNRLVIYRGSLLHTACINPAISINANPDSGRLTVNTFYNF
ncbi:DUF6445 family protein [Undibacterium pigrum]|uniref:2-oxoglutarate-Fe(II)-dependent oxygenase superfamily protein n=1 Tax=Undibacterium pigrum TaxID=401470 RepID=A0A318J9T8_9BURK|nr:DUF6445 family protein [Undibacterium pigrum]PXX43340.1 hypothetical protein DFR42_104341 [Undibacterium pigrum]